MHDRHSELTAEEADPPLWNYNRPTHGWTCFFCGETFHTPGEAEDHFGAEPIAIAGCQIKVGEERGLLMALRRAEAQIARYRAEDSDTDRAMHKMQSDHDLALRRAEEKGYARGLDDAKRHAQQFCREVNGLPRDDVASPQVLGDIGETE